MTAAPWATTTTLTMTITTYPAQAPWETPRHCAQVFDPDDGPDAMPVAETWSDISASDASWRVMSDIDQARAWASVHG